MQRNLAFIGQYENRKIQLVLFCSTST